MFAPRELSGIYIVNVVAEIPAKDSKSSPEKVFYDSLIIEYTYNGKIPLTRSTGGLIGGLIFLGIVSCAFSIFFIAAGVYMIYFDRKNHVYGPLPTPTDDVTINTTQTD
jgi:hypothetical protein